MTVILEVDTKFVILNGKINVFVNITFGPSSTIPKLFDVCTVWHHFLKSLRVMLSQGRVFAVRFRME